MVFCFPATTRLIKVMSPLPIAHTSGSGSGLGCGIARFLFDSARIERRCRSSRAISHDRGSFRHEPCRVFRSHATGSTARCWGRRCED
eukprot:127895-Amphidinium_carterae.1